MNQCNLCLRKPADKKNSHIIPKLFRKRISSNNPTQIQKIFKIDNKKKENIEQDIPKADYIVCSSCEKRFEKLETEFAEKIIKRFNNNNIESKNFRGQEYFIFNNINFLKFQLFLYSIIWRCSISNLDEFKTCKLNFETEERIRIFLDDTLDTNFELPELINIPTYNVTLFKAKITNIADNEINKMLCAANIGNNSCLILMGDFALLFNQAGEVFDFFNNNKEEKVMIVAAEIEKWKQMENIAIKEFLR